MEDTLQMKVTTSVKDGSVKSMPRCRQMEKLEIVDIGPRLQQKVSVGKKGTSHSVQSLRK